MNNKANSQRQTRSATSKIYTQSRTNDTYRYGRVNEKTHGHTHTHTEGTKAPIRQKTKTLHNRSDSTLNSNVSKCVLSNNNDEDIHTKNVTKRKSTKTTHAYLQRTNSGEPPQDDIEITDIRVKRERTWIEDLVQNTDVLYSNTHTHIQPRRQSSGCSTSPCVYEFAPPRVCVSALPFESPPFPLPISASPPTPPRVTPIIAPPPPVITPPPVRATSHTLSITPNLHVNTNTLTHRNINTIKYEEECIEPYIHTHIHTTTDEDFRDENNFMHASFEVRLTALENKFKEKELNQEFTHTTNELPRPNFHNLNLTSNSKDSKLMNEDVDVTKFEPNNPLWNTLKSMEDTANVKLTTNPTKFRVASFLVILILTTYFISKKLHQLDDDTIGALAARLNEMSARVNELENRCVKIQSESNFKPMTDTLEEEKAPIRTNVHTKKTIDARRSHTHLSPYQVIVKGLQSTYMPVSKPIRYVVLPIKWLVGLIVGYAIRLLALSALVMGLVYLILKYVYNKLRRAFNLPDVSLLAVIKPILYSDK